MAKKHKSSVLNCGQKFICVACSLKCLTRKDLMKVSNYYEEKVAIIMIAMINKTYKEISTEVNMLTS